MYWGDHWNPKCVTVIIKPAVINKLNNYIMESQLATKYRGDATKCIGEVSKTASQPASRSSQPTNQSASQQSVWPTNPASPASQPAFLAWNQFDKCKYFDSRGGGSTSLVTVNNKPVINKLNNYFQKSLLAIKYIGDATKYIGEASQAVSQQ